MNVKTLQRHEVFQLRNYTIGLAGWIRLISAAARLPLRNDHVNSQLLRPRAHGLPEGSAISKALDYSLKPWAALSRYLDEEAVPIDNNGAENQIRPWGLGRKNWLFAGSRCSGKRAAAIMSLVQSARMNGHDPYSYPKDVLTLLPAQKASEIDQLLPNKWQSV